MARGPAEISGGRTNLENAAQSAGLKTDDRAETGDNAENGILDRVSSAAGIVLVGHGSRQAGANLALAVLAEKLSNISGRYIYHAFLQFTEPTIRDVVAGLAADGFTEAVLLPVFIYEGQHVVQDIPEKIKELSRDYSMSFVLGEPLGPDHRLAEILNERLSSLLIADDPGAQIAAASLRLVEGAADLPENSAEREIAIRVVHTSGDRSLGRALEFSDQAVAAGLRALNEGRPIITDVKMVQAGINQRKLPAGNEVYAAIDNAPAGSSKGLTKCEAGMRASLLGKSGAIVIVGNAPTALNEVCRAIDAGEVPALVIGVPVGFVGAVEAKERLKTKPVEYITLPGTRGGSPIGAAIINALAILSARTGTS